MVRRVAFLFVLLFLLAACGGAPATPASTNVPAAERTVAAPSAEMAADEGVYPREVEHDTGTARLTQRPMRIYDISYHGAWALLAFGVTPVQYQMHADRAADFRQLAQTLGVELDFVEIGEAANLEAIAAARPDLILGASYLTDPIREELEALAPVVDLPGPGNGGWRDNVRIIGELLGMEQRAQELITETEQRLVAALEPYDLSGASFAFFSPGVYDGQIYICQDPSYAPVGILVDAGLKMASEVASLAGDVCTGVSLELLNEVLGTTDILVLSEVWGSSMEEFAANPVVEALPAIAEQRYTLISGPSNETVALDVFSPALTELVVPVLQQIGERYRATRGAVASDTSAATYPRTITDFEGRAVTINQPPQRIAIGSRSYLLSTLLAFDAAPVLMHTYPYPFLAAPTDVMPWEESTLQQLGADPKRVENTDDEFSLETIAAANPDLIIMNGDGLKPNLDQLTALAPTVLVAGARDWRANIRVIADTLGRPEEGERMIAGMEAKLAEASAYAEAQGATGKSFAVVSFARDGQTYVCTDNEFGPTNLLLGLGLVMTPEVAALNEGVCTPLSLERLDILATTDHLLIFQFGGYTIEDVSAQPVIQAMSALQEGRYTFVPDSTLGVAFDDLNPLSIDQILPTLREVVEQAAQAQ